MGLFSSIGKAIKSVTKPVSSFACTGDNIFSQIYKRKENC